MKAEAITRAEIVFFAINKSSLRRTNLAHVRHWDAVFGVIILYTHTHTHTHAHAHTHKGRSGDERNCHRKSHITLAFTL